MADLLLFAPLVLAALMTILGLANSKAVRPETKARLANAIVLVAVLNALALAGKAYNDKQAAAKLRIVGTLAAAKQGEPATVVLGGPRDMFFDAATVPTPVRFDKSGDTAFTCRVVDGFPLVSVDIRNKLGQVVASLEDNVWKIAPPPLTWDRNYSTSAVEVKDASKDIVLQVRLDGEKLYAQYVLYDRRGVRHSCVSDELGGAKLSVNSRDKIAPPLFLYPSELHLGQLALAGRAALPADAIAGFCLLALVVAYRIWLQPRFRAIPPRRKT